MTLVLFSGGMDSTALLARTVDREGPDQVHAVSVDYGQRHRKELRAAARITDHYGVPHTTINLSTLGASLGSALTPASGRGTIPHGHYAEPNMAATVVPNRNAVLLMVAVGIAQTTRHNTVLTAVHAGDHPVYPDCRPEFIAAADTVARAGTAGEVGVAAPFARLTKADIATVGARHNAPLHLTWSCYEGGEIHCGRCGTCVERAEAFHLAGVPDPTAYADPAFWQSQAPA